MMSSDPSTVRGDADAPSPFSYTLPGEFPPTMPVLHASNAVLVIIVLITAFAMFAVLVLAFYYIHILCKSGEKPSHHDENGVSQDFQKNTTQYMLPVMQMSSSCQAQVFTYKQVQGATSNFSPANLLAHEACYSLFKGILPDGRLLTIKQLAGCSKNIDREFRMEVDLLSRLHSPYLLELIGYCADLDHRLLVYDYMPNGSLQEHLHFQGGGRTGSNLDWSTRMRIALDAARGLEYLHEFVSPPIIHRDFKSSAILLTDNYSAKISNFGSAKVCSDKTDGRVFTQALGAQQGYVAPEYALTGQLTTKSDVYSFGIVLLELLTGHRPLDSERPWGQECCLVSWALPLLTDRERVNRLVDPILKGQYSMKELTQVAAIAVMCVQGEADYRPLMTDVVQSLFPLVKLRSTSLAINYKSKPLSSRQ